MKRRKSCHPLRNKNEENQKKGKKMKSLFVAVFLIMVICNPIQLEGAEIIANLLDGAPYSDSGVGKRKLVDEKDLFMMQVSLKPGQMVPQHTANSNVHIIVLEGQIIITVSGNDIAAHKGDLVPVAFKSLMQIKNNSTENATFVIVKTPNPTEKN